MTCARREAASTASLSPSSQPTPPRNRSRPDSPGGRLRLALFLPVLALLLGALCAFHAAPAAAQTTVWSATMAAGVEPLSAGCSNFITSLPNCSSAFSDDEFTYRGVTYTVGHLSTNSDNNFFLEFVGVTGSAAKTALTALGPMRLHLNGRKFDVSDLRIHSNGRTLFGSWGRGLWNRGQQVRVSLTVPRGLPKKPLAFRVRAGNGEVSLLWVRPNGYIDKRQYQVKEGTGAWGSWTDIPASWTNGPNSRSWTATGLTNGTAYSFRLREVNTVGPGPASRAYTVTPESSVGESLGPLPAHIDGLRALPAEDGSGAVTLRWNDPWDSSITKYQFLDPDDFWRDIRGSSASTARHVVVTSRFVCQ